MKTSIVVVLTVGGIDIRALLDTGATCTCIGAEYFEQYGAHLGPLQTHKGTVLGANDAPLDVKGETNPLVVHWRNRRAAVRTIVVRGLRNPPMIAGYDLIAALDMILRPSLGVALEPPPSPPGGLGVPPTTIATSVPESVPGTTSPKVTKVASAIVTENMPRTLAQTVPLTIPSAVSEKMPVELVTSPVSPEVLAYVPCPRTNPMQESVTQLRTETVPILNPQPVCVQRKERIPGRSTRVIGVTNPLREASCVLFHPLPMLNADLTAVSSANQGDTLYVRVINATNHPVDLQPGWTLGEAEPVTPVNTPQEGGRLPIIPTNLSSEQQMDLRGLLHEYADIFAADGPVTKTHLTEHAIHTEGPPIRLPQRRQNPRVRQEEDKLVGEMLQDGVIRPSTSPWASPVVLVAKRDSTLRFCVDFRRLNDVTIKDAQPLPRIDDTLDALYGSCWFSTLDLKSGYWQVPIQEGHKEKTAFRTSSGGLFEFNRMPFGLCNAPATFSRLMDAALSGLSWKICLCYLDDIIVYAASWQEHLNRLRQVFQRVREAGLRLHPDKCSLGARQVDFLGHQVSAEGLRPSPRNVEALTAIKPPTSVTEVRQFVGLASYYRRFVPQFAKIARPLHQLTKKGTPFEWTTECQQAFQDLKDKLAARPITAFPDFTAPFRVYTDASGTGLGAILAQVQDGRERIIMSASRSLTSGEKNYPVTKLECLAIYWAVLAFRHFLLCQPFEVFTDHYSLKWLRTMKTSSALLHRWAATLEEYNFVVRHQPGSRQGHVDALSRLPREKIAVVRLQSKEEAKKTIQELHDATHLGYKGTLSIFKERFSFKNCSKICRDIVNNCKGCQQGKDYGRNTLGVASSIGALRPWHTIAIDVMGPFRPHKGKKFIISIIDCYSKFCILLPQADHTAETVSKAIFERVVSYFGVPERVLSDNGTEFVSQIWTSLGNLLGYRPIHASPYHPQGNGMVERLNRSCTNVLRATLLKRGTQDWPTVLPTVMLALNALPHEPHRHSAAEVLYGQPLRLPVEPLSATTHVKPIPTYVEQLQKCLIDVREALSKPSSSSAAVNPYIVGDSLVVITQPHERAHKLAPRWAGPFIVEATPNAHQVIYTNGQITRKAHISNTKPYRGVTNDRGKSAALEAVRKRFARSPGPRDLGLAPPLTQQPRIIPIVRDEEVEEPDCSPGPRGLGLAPSLPQQPRVIPAVRDEEVEDPEASPNPSPGEPSQEKTLSPTPAEGKERKRSCPQTPTPGQPSKVNAPAQGATDDDNLPPLPTTSVCLGPTQQDPTTDINASQARNPPPNTNEGYITRSGRISRPPKWLDLFATVRKVKVVPPIGRVKTYGNATRLRSRIQRALKFKEKATIQLLTDGRATTQLGEYLRRHWKEQDFVVDERRRYIAKLGGPSIKKEGQMIGSKLTPSKGSPSAAKNNQLDLENASSQTNNKRRGPFRRYKVVKRRKIIVTKQNSLPEGVGVENSQVKCD